MVILRKIKSATLAEAIVATIIIVIVFAVASLVLNNLLVNSFSKKSYQIEPRMNELMYLASYEKLELPHTEQYGAWDVAVRAEKKSSSCFDVIITARKGKYMLNAHKLCPKRD